MLARAGRVAVGVEIAKNKIQNEKCKMKGTACK
jgi:hypothetical protein